MTNKTGKDIIKIMADIKNNQNTSMSEVTKLEDQISMLLKMDNLSHLITNINMLGLGASANPGLMPGLEADSWLPQTGVVDQATQLAHKELQNLTNLYKTQLCKHFDANGGHCSKGSNCHFAHGF